MQHLPCEKIHPLSCTCSLRTQGPRFPVSWQYCQISMDFFQFHQNSAISSDLAFTRPFNGLFNPFVFHLLTEDSGTSILSVVHYCLILMNSFQFRQNWAIYTDLAVIPIIQWSFKPFVSHLLAEDPGLSIPSAVAILPYFDGFLPILSKLYYLDRCNLHPATKMPKLTLCFPPAR